MLKVMRSSFQHLKWILIFIVFIFVLFIFVDWGAGGANQQGAGDRGFAARVNGETIPISDFERALYFAEKNYEQMYNQPLTPEIIEALGLPQQVVGTLIDQQLMLQEAKELDLDATPEEVRKRILEIPVLNPDGKFVGQDVYERYIRSMGFGSASNFESEIAREVTLSKLESAIQSSIVIPVKLAEQEYRRRSETAKIQYFVYPVERAMATTSATPAELQQYYQANVGKYAHADQDRIKYLLADVARIRSQMKLDDATLRAAYESSKEKYKSGESVHAQHILIKANGSTPADDQAARKKAEDLVAQLRGGADFAKLAAENSADPGSATRGGDLGYFEKGRMVPEFESAAFSLAPGQISDPVKTNYGYHIIKALDRRAGGYKPFEEVRMQLEAQLLDERAKDQAREQILQVKARVDQKKPKTDADLRAFATDQVSINDTGWVAKTETITGLGRVPALNDWAAKAAVGDVGAVIATPRGPMIPWLSAKRPAGTSALDEVKARVERDAKLAKARDAARQQVAAVLKGDLNAAAASLGVTTAETTVSGGGFVSGFTGDVQPLVEAAVSSNVGEVKGPVVVDQGAVAFKVVEQNKFNPQTFESQKSSIVEMMRQTEARKLRASLLAKLRKGAKVQTNDELLAQYSGRVPTNPQS